MEVAKRKTDGKPVLTHALCPESYKLRLRGCPSTGKHSVESTSEALQDAVAGDTGGHTAQRAGCQSDGGYMAYGHYGRDDEGVFEDVRSRCACDLSVTDTSTSKGADGRWAHPKTGRVYFISTPSSSLYIAYEATGGSAGSISSQSSTMRGTGGASNGVVSDAFGW